ncbi:scarecrow-like protein 32 [Impatiens glandulifera]|uniref:scarecrow-like protein 32 n=1 Tax=Impatiens glandulifera TaxID=253017 RepID=UPI001FB066D6|nr:scarecrow-like protein 32 [Impatiens glandulifera]
MMQFTETTFLSTQNNQFLNTGFPAFPTAVTPPPPLPQPKPLENCMEQLLVHCANAIESNDATLSQQILWVLNNIAPPDGDSNQRLASAFLRALITRAATCGSSKLLSAVAAASSAAETIETHRFSVIDLAAFVDLTPWHRFGFTAANAALLDAVLGFRVIHVVDLSLTHCMQIPTLIDSIAARRPEGLALVKLTTVVGSGQGTPPLLDLSYEELGLKLSNFAMSRNITLEFTVVKSDPSDGFSSLIDHLRTTQRNQNEALVVNCQMMLHRIPEETVSFCHRTMFLNSLRGLEPTIVILVDEDADFTSNNLVTRLRSAFNYLWIPFDTIDTFLPKGSKKRQWYEAEICWKIENVIAREGNRRVERQETKGTWGQRMMAANFHGVGFGEEAVKEVKGMLEEHAAGWGMKREEDDLVLTWKGHDVVFATAWKPAM